MARIELAPGVFEDFDRVFDHLAQFDTIGMPERIGAIVQALQILEHSPLIGRRVAAGKRELVIGQDSHGYVALYRYVKDIDVVFVLDQRSQLELGFRRGD